MKSDDCQGAVAPGSEERRSPAAARAEGEERYRLLVQRAVHGIYRTTIDGRILEANPAFAQMLGYSCEELQGMNARDWYRDPVERQRLIARYQRDPRRERVSEQVAFRHKDGRVIRASLNGRALRDSAGSLTGFEVIAEDLTEKAEMQARLVHAQKMEAMGRLAAGVAHDFNNVLTVVKGYSESRLQEAAEGSVQRRAAEQIGAAADRASSLIHYLLAFSRQQAVQPRLLDLNRLITDTQKMLERFIGEDIRLTVRLSPLPVLVELDPGHLTQVILNLAATSRDAMPQGGTLTIEVSQTDLSQPCLPLEPGRYALLSVSDSACGVEREGFRHILEALFSCKQPGEGHAPGLATLYAIVKQSGGDIQVTAQPGRGTTFSVYLPRAEEACPDGRLQPAAAPARSPSATILLVEDEERVRELIAALLRRQGHAVLEAGDGQAAAEAAKASPLPIELLMTDVVMPGISGPELVAMVQALHPNAKVIYMSGYSEESMAQHGWAGGGVPLLQKPFTIETLRAAVQEVLGARC